MLTKMTGMEFWWWKIEIGPKPHLDDVIYDEMALMCVCVCVCVYLYKVFNPHPGLIQWKQVFKARNGHGSITLASLSSPTKNPYKHVRESIRLPKLYRMEHMEKADCSGQLVSERITLAWWGRRI